MARLRQAGVRDDTTALKLAALDVADEVFRARETAGDMGARLGALVSLLEQTTGP